MQVFLCKTCKFCIAAVIAMRPASKGVSEGGSARRPTVSARKLNKINNRVALHAARLRKPPRPAEFCLVRS
jgi:hypothetical protein